MFILFSRVKGIWIIVRADDFISGGLRHKLKWLEGVVDKHFKSKHTVMGASSDLSKSLVMLNRKILWQGNGNACIPDKILCEKLNLQHPKTVITPAVGESESVDCESTRECSWKSARALDSQSEEASTHGVVVDADKTSLCRSAVARLKYWEVGRPDMQYAVRVCSKSVSTTPRRLVVQSDSDWAGDKSTRKSVSPGDVRYGQHLLRSWSQDQTVIAMSSGEAELYVACMAAQQAMGTENMARELGVHLDATELQVDANAVIGIIGRQGLDLS